MAASSQHDSSSGFLPERMAAVSLLRFSITLSFYVLAYLPVEPHHYGDDPAEADLLYGCHEQDAGVPGHAWDI